MSYARPTCPTPDKASFPSEYEALLAPHHPTTSPYRCRCGKWHHATRKFRGRKRR